MRQLSCFDRRWIAIVTASVAVAAALGAATPVTAQLLTNSRAPYVHMLNLSDEDGRIINPRDRDARPYSPTATCTQCHNINAINHGWHFNANVGNVEAGRPGEPWILTDPTTRTQMPLSYRLWPGTHHPNAVGMTEFDMTRKFGRHMPGGGPGLGPATPEGKAQDPHAMRWQISGYLENDCMMCHSRSNDYDLNAWARQMQDENFRWAPSAAMGLARIVGASRQIPDDFDPEFPEFHPNVTQVAMQYNPAKFTPDNRVFFDVVRKPSMERCYQCHSTHEVDEVSVPRWQNDIDVHMLAGMNCADCHRHGIDHDMVRGYDGEAIITGVYAATALSCAGCHSGEVGTDDPHLFGGRLGAPIPEHKGIPPLHFETLSCTACHSGPWPREQSQAVQTSLAHALGLGDEYRKNEDPPFITQPVFVRNDQGLIEPHRMVWPAYWGVLQDGEVGPFDVEKNRDNIVRFLQQAQRAEQAKQDEADKEAAAKKKYARGFAPLSQAEIAGTLKSLQRNLSEGQQAVYITGGKLHKLEDEELVAIDHAAAEPYSWPLGHDVRPANMSLGARSCMECHAADSPFVAGLVAALPVSPNEQVIRAMHELQDVDIVLWDAWARGFAFRTLFKIIGFSAAGVIALVLLWFAMQSISAAHQARKKEPTGIQA